MNCLTRRESAVIKKDHEHMLTETAQHSCYLEGRPVSRLNEFQSYLVLCFFWRGVYTTVVQWI